MSYAQKTTYGVTKYLPPGLDRVKVWKDKLHQGPVVQRMGNFIQWINFYPADKICAFLILIGLRANFIYCIGIYPLDEVIHSSYNHAQVIK